MVMRMMRVILDCHHAYTRVFPKEAPEVKLLPFLRENALSERSSGVSLRNKFSFPKDVHQAAGGEAFRRKPPEVKLLSETSSASRRTFIKPPEVKLPEGSEGRPSFGRKRRTPFLREEAEGRPSFGRKPPEVKLLSETSSSSRQR